MTDDDMVVRELLLICGSLRAASTNMAMMRTVLQMLPDGVAGTLYEGLATLPHFDPDDDHDPLPAAVEPRDRTARRVDQRLYGSRGSATCPRVAGCRPWLHRGAGRRNGMQTNPGAAGPH